MAVYYKFKSARDYDPIPIDGHFISVANLKERIFESKHLGRGTDFDLMVSNSQTNEEYVDEATLIPKNTRVLVRRVPGRPRKPIITQPDEPKTLEDKVEEVPQNHSLAVADPSVMRFPEESEFDEFGNDLYAIPEVHPAQTPNTTVNTISTCNVDEESKLKALIDTPALQWQQQTQDNNGPGRSFGRGMGGRMMPGRGFGNPGRGGFDRKTPPQGYICHRCKVPGHFIQHCSTNGDPTYDIRRVKPPTGIPKSMLMATPDGSYALPSGAVAVLKPNEAAFEKEIEGLPSTRTVTDNIPDELRCPLCKEVMKDAVLTAKCCFSSFCDKCIRDHIISKSMCVCGFANILADDLVPNRTVRETISRMMETTTTSNSENAGSLLPVRDMESARPVSPKVPSPTLSAHKKDPVPHLEHPPEVRENVKKEKVGVEFLDRAIIHSAISEPPRETVRAKATSLESAPFPEEESQGRFPSGEQVKKKKKKTRLLGSGIVSDVPLRPNPDLENFAGMPFPPSGYNPYFPGAPWGMDGYMAPFPGLMPMMGFPQGPFDVPFGGVMPQDPFAAQSYMNNMMSMLPRRDPSEFGMGTVNKNIGHQAMSRKEYEARKGNLAWRESERENGRVHSRESEHKREKGSDPEKSLRQKPKMVSQGSGDRPGRDKSPLRNNSVRDSSRLASPARISKGKCDQEEVMAAAERKQKASVFSRISFPEAVKESSSKKKASEPPNGLKEHHESTHRREERRSAARSSSTGLGKRNTYEYESSEEEYHFKRRPSLLMHDDREKEERHSRGSKERERERAHDYDHERPSKRRRG